MYEAMCSPDVQVMLCIVAGAPAACISHVWCMHLVFFMHAHTRYSNGEINIYLAIKTQHTDDMKIAHAANQCRDPHRQTA
jgi:hypothetical protein